MTTLPEGRRVGEIRSISAGGAGCTILSGVVLTGEEKPRKKSPVIGHDTVPALDQPNEGRKHEYLREPSESDSFKNEEHRATRPNHSAISGNNVYRSLACAIESGRHRRRWRFLIRTGDKPIMTIAPPDPGEHPSSHASAAVP